MLERWPGVIVVSSTRVPKMWRAWWGRAGLGLRGLPLLLGGLSISFAPKLQALDGLEGWQVRLLGLCAVATLVLGLLFGFASRQTGSSELRFGHALRILWPPALPLVGLVCLPHEWRFIAIAVSAVLAVRSVPRGACGQLVDTWAWRGALLGFAAWGAVAFIAIGRALPGSNDNDAAYYFGMARHLVLTHRWDEPLVWQFLTRTPHIAHAPFDYWHGLTALSLVPAMAVFGPTASVAGTVMGVVSGASLLLFAYLISCAAPLENPALQVLALLLFMWSPAVVPYRFDVETIPFVHVWILASVIALAKRRLGWAAAFACFSFLWRAETIPLTILLCGAAAYFALIGRSAKRDLIRVSLVVAALAFSYVTYHWCLFGTPGPPGALLASNLIDGMAGYNWQDKPAAWAFARRFSSEYIAGRVQVAADTLEQANFFPYHSLWLGCALLAAKAVGSRRRGVDAVARCLLFAGAAAVALASPAVFASWRSLHTLLPVFVLAGAYGAENVLNGLSSFIECTTRSLRLSRMCLACCTGGIALALIHPLNLSAVHPAEHAFAKELAALDSTFAGEPVMTAHSWFALAYTSAPAVGLPLNGEQAIAGVLRHYGVKWLFIVNDEDTVGSPSLTSELRSSARAQIDGVQLSLRQRTNVSALFHVD